MIDEEMSKDCPTLYRQLHAMGIGKDAFGKLVSGDQEYEIVWMTGECYPGDCPTGTPIDSATAQAYVDIFLRHSENFLGSRTIQFVVLGGQAQHNITEEFMRRLPNTLVFTTSHPCMPTFTIEFTAVIVSMILAFRAQLRAQLGARYSRAAYTVNCTELVPFVYQKLLTAVGQAPTSLGNQAYIMAFCKAVQSRCSKGTIPCRLDCTHQIFPFGTPDGDELIRALHTDGKLKKGPWAGVVLLRQAVVFTGQEKKRAFSAIIPDSKGSMVLSTLGADGNLTATMVNADALKLQVSIFPDFTLFMTSFQFMPFNCFLGVQGWRSHIGR